MKQGALLASTSGWRYQIEVRQGTVSIEPFVPEKGTILTFRGFTPHGGLLFEEVKIMSGRHEIGFRAREFIPVDDFIPTHAEVQQWAKEAQKI